MAQLTVPEGEIADLVAQGLSNQTIAVKPYVSRRTVESHLSAIYRKADVASRVSRSSADRSWPDRPDRRSVGCTGDDVPRGRF
ncbi:helix-turn-helix transcriptional regulator [Streptomyces sp. NPDC088921]|uniref:helix-turn-helix domain-containing protein n=1 Tax=unclassified Streptomyces TaxID=2593676 RepID=UPI0034384514